MFFTGFLQPLVGTSELLVPSRLEHLHGKHLRAQHQRNSHLGWATLCAAIWERRAAVFIYSPPTYSKSSQKPTKCIINNHNKPDGYRCHFWTENNPKFSLGDLHLGGSASPEGEIPWCGLHSDLFGVVWLISLCSFLLVVELASFFVGGFPALGRKLLIALFCERSNYRGSNLI